MKPTTDAKRKRGEGSLFTVPNSPYLHAQYYNHGRAIRVSTKEVDERKAQKFLDERIAEVRCGIHKDPRKLRYEQLRAGYYADYAANRRKSLRHDKEGHPTLDKVKRLDGFFSGWLANDIDADSVRKFQAAELAKGRAAGTVNRSVSSLCRMFTLAKEDGKLRDVPYFPMLKEAAPRSGFFERKQLDALLEVLPDYLKLPVALGFYTGMREGEILRLRWSQIDFERNEIVLRDGETKNDKGRVVPVVGPLQPLLVACYRRRPAGMEFVCWRKNHKGKAEPIQSFRKAWNHACCKIGLGEEVPVLDKNGEKVMRKPRGLRSKPKPKTKYRGAIFHSLRRSCVRNLVRSGVPEVVAMRISGHKSRAVFDRYNIVSPRDVSDASRKLETFLKAEALADQHNPTLDTERAQPEPKTQSIN